MTTSYTDVLEAIETIVKSNAWPHTLYISEKVQEEWANDTKFNDPNQPSDTPTVKSVNVKSDQDERVVGEKENGERVVVYL